MSRLELEASQQTSESWPEEYARIRAFSERLCETLCAEDCCIQSMPDASPVRWHLAHTTWFFETFLLRTRPEYQVFNPQFEFLFNSYYNTLGKQFPRPQRGLLSRPTLEEVRDYRRHVDGCLLDLVRQDDWEAEKLDAVLEIGLQHEQQHQELILTDVKHLFFLNPLLPAYREGDSFESPSDEIQLDSEWHEYPAGMYEIGHSGTGFAYDNEGPRHQVHLADFALSDRLVTNREYRQFVEDGGYQRPEFWLSLGWNTVQGQQWECPFYWRRQDNQWHEFTLAGLQPLVDSAPVSHVSYFEADAYARWTGARLPREDEWEAAVSGVAMRGNFADALLADHHSIHPRSCRVSSGRLPRQMFGDVWEWTASPYEAYPGYVPPPGALGEYNGKFMCNQYVLRGGSCATSSHHIRATYRNFFPPDARWQFSGFRLAR